MDTLIQTIVDLLSNIPVGAIFSFLYVVGEFLITTWPGRIAALVAIGWLLNRFSRM